MRLKNLSWKQFEKIDREKPVIIPTGAIEVYGPHLPMGGDAIVADRVADMVVDRLNLLVTPTIEMGDSLSLVTPAFPGTMVIKPEHFKGYLEDVCLSLIRWGFKKIFFLNTHVSNNFMITQLGWELEDKYQVRCASMDWWRFIQPFCEDVCDHTGMMAHGHASEAGTSVLKYLVPELGTDDVLEKGGAVNNEIVTIGHIPYVVNKYGVYNEENELAGVVLFFQKYMEMEKTRNKLRSKMIPKGHEARYTMDSILGKSAVIGELKNIAHKMAESSSTVLITGESGTGKEVFAQAIHNASSRKNMPFIAVNCSALAASLLESELFGYEEGAFTGARKGGKIGLFEMADKGTWFLDEIGEIPFELQAKLLRVLMEREVMRIGGTDLIRVDVRIIAATNKNLLELTREGKFREDLYYRINVLPLPLPPLRERKEDIPMLAQAFLQEFGADKALSGKVLRILRGYDWPGNIRELHNCIEYMYQLSDDTIEAEDIPEHIRFCRCETPRPLYNQLSDRQRQILRAVYDFGLEKRTAGRKSLHLQFAAQGNSVGEQEIRVVLKELEHMGLVEVGKGRRGTTITEWGINVIRSLT